MITPYGQECKYYYEDFHRGRSTQECRLLKGNQQEERWDPSLCKTCPVPGILRANNCPNMVLEGRIVRHFFFWRRVEVTAFCLETLEEVEDPYVGCGRCHLHRPGAEELFGLEEEEPG
ncbi:MAG: hypothetical protein U9Q78_06820 [Chloroflexota bacterium]|nr:hypothetical protein [Chloroflexota bacterium]